MFVWHDVLTDYTSGLACVIANSEKEAISKLRKAAIEWVDKKTNNNDNWNAFALLQEITCEKFKGDNILSNKEIMESLIIHPEVKEIAIVWGGG
jgi:hypothetical protein